MFCFAGAYDQRRDPVTPGTPAALPPMPADFPRTRLGFAKWLLLPENPLPARVTVNRFWQEIFGSGIVRTTGDFGITGELPSHPELLDYLAISFRENNWDVKKFFKLHGDKRNLQTGGAGHAGEALQRPAEQTAVPRSRASVWTPK